MSLFLLYTLRPTDGGTALIRALKGKRINNDSPKKFYQRKKKIINWGTSALEYRVRTATFLNHPAVVLRNSNKIAFFDRMTGKGLANYIPLWSTDRKEALEWLKQGSSVVSRALVQSHSGKGITITKPKAKEPLPDVPLYTVYIPKDEEYRVHVVQDPTGKCSVFYVQKKVKRKDFQGKPNRKVRCYDNGYTYQHNDIDVPDKVQDAVIRCFVQSDLQFGAVDVIWSREANRAVVLEINTAPGLEGTSLKVYADMFKKYFD